MKSYTLDDLARMIDHTNLHTDASPKDMEVLCNEAKDYHFAMVAINQVQSGLCAKLLEGTDIHTGAAISFPLGQTTIASKVFDTKDAITNGANEIDYVVNQTEVKASNWDYIKDEMSQIVAACHEKDVTCRLLTIYDNISSYKFNDILDMLHYDEIDTDVIANNSRKFLNQSIYKKRIICRFL